MVLDPYAIVSTLPLDKFREMKPNFHLHHDSDVKFKIFYNNTAMRGTFAKAKVTVLETTKLLNLYLTDDLNSTPVFGADWIDAFSA